MFITLFVCPEYLSQVVFWMSKEGNEQCRLVLALASARKLSCYEAFAAYYPEENLKFAADEVFEVLPLRSYAARTTPGSLAGAAHLNVSCNL
jgi:hypothetical protein